MVTQFNQFSAAAMTFRDKYSALPGDMPNSELFWGTATNCSTPGTDVSGTCNGTGDGWIEWNAKNEMLRSWQMMRLAGLVEGSTTGADYINANMSSLMPGSKYRPGTVIWMTETKTNAGVAGAGPLLFSLRTASSWNQAISAENAWNIDKKLDDGLPNRGFVRATGDNTCSVQEDGITAAGTHYAGEATYVVTATNDACGFKMRAN